MEDVCNSIYSALENVKKYSKYEFTAECERKAYLDAFEECQLICRKHDLKPDEMLQALSDYHTEVTTDYLPVPFFSLARWFYKPNAAREQAVIVAFELVDSISKRFLP